MPNRPQDIEDVVLIDPAANRWAGDGTRVPPRAARADAAFMASHPAHWVGLGFGAGLSPLAPGTVGTLWAWLTFPLLRWALGGDVAMALFLLAATLVGWWACTLSAKHLGVTDPSAVVWDEVLAFWAVLWLIQPAGLGAELAAFALFRYFDAAKPGPVGWADRLYHGVNTRDDPWGWRKAGWGILLDDLVAAFCTLLVIAVWRAW